MPRNHGRVGNEGFSYFSETAFKNLEKAIQKLEQYNRLQQQMTKASAEQYQNMYITADKYARELKDMGIDINSNIGALKRQYETEKEIYDQRQIERQRETQDRQRQQKERKDKEKEQKRTKIMQQWERDFQTLTSQASAKEIENQKKLNKIKDEAIKKAEDLRLSETKRQEILNNAAKKYNEEQRRQRQKASSRSNRETVVNSIFGTTSQDIKDVEDGTYGWKLITRTFAKAVEVFKNAVKEGITANYNSTEKTLNRITASNRISWSSGSFQPSKYGFTSNKTYNGYEKINNAINDQLLADGLYNNIANTEVMEAVAKLTSQDGLDLERAIAKGYQDTVIKYIVPYLDTTSEAFTNVEYLMPRNIKKYSFYSYKC